MPRRMGAGRGQTLVEFALIIPIFLIILLGLFDLGRVVFAYTAVTNAAREGARLAIVNQDPAIVLARIRSQSSVAETTNGDGTDITIKYRRADSAGDVIPNSDCKDADGHIPIGCLAEVTFKSKLNLITPLVAQVVFPNGLTMSATTVLPVEFTCPNPTIGAGTGCPKNN